MAKALCWGQLLWGKTRKTNWKIILSIVLMI